MNQENKKNITIISLNYFPEDTAIGLYSTQMVNYLVKSGFNVNVITGFPYYPKWEISSEYKDKDKFLVEEMSGYMIYRYKQYTPKNPSFVRRIIQMVDFYIGSLKNIKKIKENDLVVAVIPFTLSALLGVRLARITKSKLWIHIQDFEFDAAFESGFISKLGILSKVLYKLFMIIESSLLNKADVVSSISRSMIAKAEKKSVVKKVFFPNWADTEIYKEDYNDKYHLFDKEKKTILYSGNVGAKQDWEQYVEVISMFRDSSDIEFVIVGAGGKIEWLKDQCKNQANVKFFDPIPYNELPHMLKTADIHLLFQKSDVVDSVMPSKIIGMMSSGKPSIITGNRHSEVASVYDQNQVGIYNSSGDSVSIYNDINELLMDSDKCKTFGENANNYVERNLNKESILGEIYNKLDKIILGEKI